MLITDLRRATAAEHAALEQSVPLLDPNLTVATYRVTLLRFASVVACWELVGRRMCPEPHLTTFDARCRSALLLTDLQNIGESTLAFPPCQIALEEPASFWGALYVMEGSTLGGQLISRHLEEALGFRDGHGYRFFRGHGQDTGRLWKEFCALFEEETTGLDDGAVVRGAEQIFAAFRHATDSRQLVDG